MANNTKINHIMVSFNDHYNAIYIDRLPSKTKIGKDSRKRFRKIILFYVSPSSPQLQSDWREYTKYRFKENARTFSKSSTTPENTRSSKPKRGYEI